VKIGKRGYWYSLLEEERVQSKWEELQEGLQAAGNKHSGS
jgi:hypothetical protein